MNSTPDHRAVRVHFLLGPAGSGKTWRCLAEIRAELKSSPDGPPLLLLAPKQATFQLERQLLDDRENPPLAGYTRLQIVSFDRLAHWLLDTFATVPDLLDDEGRVMVLRALLAREQASLRVFRATARLPGFARQLSQLLREFQRHLLTPQKLARLAERCTENAPLRNKLHDLHHLLRAYHDWLAQSQIQDADQLLDLATELLRESPSPIAHSPFPIAGLWLDGFAEMTPQELDLLCGVLPFCRTATLAFCLDQQAADSKNWLSLWSTVRRTYGDCSQRIRAFPNCDVSVEDLPRNPAHSRFRDTPTLARLEADWAAPIALVGQRVPLDLETPAPAQAESEVQSGRPDALSSSKTPDPIPHPLRLRLCANPEAEATLAAREILRHVRAGGRFRDCAVILRTLDHHHTPLRRVFTRYGIPFFLDRREPVAHHPLAELTRFALRTLAYGWQPDDLFGALKTGLAHDRDEDIDWLENLALSHGWRGAQWLEPLNVPEPKFNLPRAEHLRVRLTSPFRKLSEQLNAPPASFILPGSAFSGSSLAEALRSFWEDLAIEPRLQGWDDALADESDSPNLAPPLHTTVLRQMHAWLDNLERAFPPTAPTLPLRDWLPILEAGLSSLSVGVIPPALDQVLIGTIDRSRNSELHLAIVLGLNEGTFPAPPVPPVLLTDTERDFLASHDTRLGLDPRAQIAHERYFAYIACTRSRTRLMLSCSAADVDGKPLHPSPILAQVQQLFPGLDLEKVPTSLNWREAEHTDELLEPLLRQASGMADPAFTILQTPDAIPKNLFSFPTIAPVIARWHELTAARALTSLPPAAVTALYETELRTSVSKLEQFAECPFKFFVAAGLCAQEREEFEVEHRERGTFSHRLLDEFHLRITASGRRWRDISPDAAAALAARIGEDLLASPEFAVFGADEARRFAARTLIASAQRLLAALVGWMPHYAFDPSDVELAFGLGDNPTLPALHVPLSHGHSLSLRGRIDRVDHCRDAETGETVAVVVDYKSSPKKLDPIKIANGLQLQLLAYLNVLSAQAGQCVPAGVFYIPLHGAAGSTGARGEILAEDEAACRTTYKHVGRFDFAQLSRLDDRTGGQPSGQFRYTLNKDGALRKGSGDARPTAEFNALLTQVEANLRRLGEAIFAGEVSVSPIRLSASDKACDRCEYRPICRFDPWAQPYRPLPKPTVKEDVA